jgi:hypothetical protein
LKQAQGYSLAVGLLTGPSVEDMEPMLEGKVMTNKQAFED